MRERIEALMAEIENLSCKTEQEIEQARVRLLGKKGEITAILKQMGKLSAEERPVIGQLANKVREDIENEISTKIEKKNYYLCGLQRYNKKDNTRN